MATREEMGKLMAASRRAMGRTQQQLTEVTGIHKSTLSAMENGRFTGSLDIYERYLDALGLTLKVVPKEHRLPDWDEIETMFAEE